MDDLERRWVRRARRGSESAMTALYERYRKPLFGYLLRQLGHRETAEDVFQEAWIKVFRSIDRYDASRGSFRAWAFRIAGNAAIDRRRRERARGWDRAASEEPHREPDDLVSPAPGPERTGMAREAVEAVHRTLAKLPERQRRALLLRYQQGLTYAEIAVAMEIADGTAKTLVHRGTLLLRSRLSGAGHPSAAGEERR